MSHIHEKVDFTTAVYIVYNNTVLLRMHDKYNVWNGPGGHVEPDEDPNQAIIREAKEEAGLDIELVDVRGKTATLNQYPRGQFDHRELIPPVFLNRHRINEKHEHVDMVFFARTTTNVIKPSAEEKVVEMHWFTKEDLEGNRYDEGMRDQVKFYALDALKELSS